MIKFKNILVTLILFLSVLFVNGQVPNTNTFTLDTVRKVLGLPANSSLSACFNAATKAFFDPLYDSIGYAPVRSLKRFRNYTPIIGSGFKTEWTVSGIESQRTITLPLYNAGVFNCTIDWGDGHKDTITTYDDPDRIHIYSTDGTYISEIKGECPSWSFNSSGSYLKLTNIVYWGDSSVFGGFGYLTNGFSNCTNCKSLGTGKIISKSGLTTLNGTFKYMSNSSFTSIPSGLFDNCIYLSASGFYETFYGCSKIISVPSGLFKYNTLVSSSGFYETFRDCANLQTIPSDLFATNTALTTSAFVYTFGWCYKLQSIPDTLFKHNTNITSSAFYGTFMNDTTLTYIPGNLFTYNVNVTSAAFWETFSGCKNIISIPDTLFKYNTKLTTTAFLRTFSSCSKITSIPGILFKTNTLVSTEAFNGTFSNTGITSIPDTLFKYNTAVGAGGFNATFGGTKITKIPKYLFKYNVNVSSNTSNNTGGFAYTFGATRIDSIPVELFQYNTQVTEYAFSRTFQNCDSLIYIPGELFKYNVNVSANGFNSTFYDCNKIATIPGNLFKYNINVTANGFASLFSSCNKITSIPDTLFKYNVNVSYGGFDYAFKNCTSLDSIPNYLFRYNKKVYGTSIFGGFKETFYGCNKAKINQWIFYADGEQTTRFNQIPGNVSFENCFYRTSFTGTQGNAPDLWNCTGSKIILSNPAPATQWVPGDIITGQSSLATSEVIAHAGYNMYYSIKNYTGTYQLGEIIGVTGVPAKLSDQGASYPIITDYTLTPTTCFGGAGNSLTSISNYSDIPSGWK